VNVLEAAGWTVRIPTAPVCCGLTWISTGQLKTAKKVLRRTVATLRPWLAAGTPIIGLEPSCTAVFRSDAPELLDGDPDIERLSGQVSTFSEALLRYAPDGWEPPQLARRALVQKHCHQHAVLGSDPDGELLRRADVDADFLDSGCCGLAGNFGFERGHHDVSMACAERVLLPAVRDAAPDALVLADGFSCRTQIEEAGTGRRAMHLAEALAMGLSGHAPVQRPELVAAPRPASSTRDGKAATAVAAGLLTGAALTAVPLIRGSIRTLRHRR
jgi:Fe-S oxidoreductase